MLERWFGDAVGGLKWRPKDFWKASLAEFFLAIDGHNRAQGSHRPEPMGREEFEELAEQYLRK